MGDQSMITSGGCDSMYRVTTGIGGSSTGSLPLNRLIAWHISSGVMRRASKLAAMSTGPDQHRFVRRVIRSDRLD